MAAAPVPGTSKPRHAGSPAPTPRHTWLPGATRSRRPSRGQGGQALSGLPGPLGHVALPRPDGGSEGAVQGDLGLPGRGEAESCQVRHGHPRWALGKVPWGEGGRHAQAGALENSQPRRLSPGTNPQVDRWPPSHTAMGQGDVRGLHETRPPSGHRMGFYACPSPQPPTPTAVPPVSPRSSLAARLLPAPGDWGKERSRKKQFSRQLCKRSGK